MQTLSSTKTQSWLIWFLRGLLILGFFILFGRLFELQVIRGKYFKVLAEENRIRRINISAPRGKIIARGGEILVDNSPVKKRIIFDDKEGVKKIAVEDKYEGEDMIVEWERMYLNGSNFSHITGYLGEVNEEELGKIEAECSEKGPKKIKDYVGRNGIEKYYNCHLSGRDGEELTEVNAVGKNVRILGQRKAVKGDDLILSIDFGLQEKAASLMKDKKGVVIASDSKGEILALYSSPSYDANIFVKPSLGKVESLFEDENLPLFNRAIGGVYHPGSVFKPIVAIAALEEGKISRDFIYEDTGAITIKTLYGSFSYTNWYLTQYGGVEGKINLEKAIARSTDTFFYKIGEMTGAELIKKWAENFGLDKKTGIDLPGEVAGLVPDPEWKMKVKGERWFLGNTYHMSIGQGDIALTPMAINSAITTISNDGEYCSPHLLKEIPESGSSKFMQFPEAKDSPFQCKNLSIRKENIDLVKEGMRQACESGGTGYTFFDFKEKNRVDVGCKTGTAEVEDEKEPHAWFTVFAPIYNPEIILTVMIENGGEGSRIAGPIAREIMDYWFLERRN